MIGDGKKFVHVVGVSMRLVDGSEGASAEFVCEDAPADHVVLETIAAAKALGLNMEIESQAMPIATLGDLRQWLGEYAPRPAIERTAAEIEIDELKRAQRNTDRKLDTIMEMMKRLATPDERAAFVPGPVRVERLHGIPEDAVPPAAFASGPEPAQHVNRLGRGHAIETGETSQSAANRLLVQQQTGVGGVLAGNMQLQGESASSEVWGIGPDGNPSKGALPKVGDSLKPPHLRNG